MVFEATAAAGEGDLPRSVDTEDVVPGESRDTEDVVPGESRDAPRCYAVKRIEKKGMDDRAKQEVLQEVGLIGGDRVDDDVLYESKCTDAVVVARKSG